MRPTLEELNEHLKNEAGRHALDPQSFLLDVPPAIVAPHERGYLHNAKCLCGEKLSVVTTHSGRTLAGQQEVVTAIGAEYGEHFRQAIARMIFALYEPAQ